MALGTNADATISVPLGLLREERLYQVTATNVDSAPS